MGSTVELHPDAIRQLKRLTRQDRPLAKRITMFLAGLEGESDPRSRGKGVTGPSLNGLWRYRVGDWRIVVDIHDGELIVLALDIDHRSRIYG